MSPSLKRWPTLRRWRRRASKLASFSWWQSWIPFVLTPTFVWLVVSFPFKWILSSWHAARTRHLLQGVPAVAALIAVGYLYQTQRAADTSVILQYWQKAEAAIAAEDFTRAELLLNRVLQANSHHVNDARFGMATILEKTGNASQAELLFSKLAPEDRVGHRPSHKRIAIILSRSLPGRNPTSEQLRRLHWHLQSASDPNSPEIVLANGRYALAVGDFDTASRYLERAAEYYPEIWAILGDVHAQLNNSGGSLRSYRRASEHLASKLSKDNTDVRTRADYAAVLIRLGKLDAARTILTEGRRQDPSGDWDQRLAGLYIYYHDLLAAEENPDLAEVLKPLSKSLEHEPNFEPALSRLISYAKPGPDGNEKLRAVLSRVVAEAEEPALAHLALGNLSWLEEKYEQATLHFDRAVELRSNMPVILNNIAWIIAHNTEEPDLDRAMVLVSKALEQAPDNPRFLDTRGNIYLLQGNWKSALSDLESVLRRVPNKPPVHRNLATIYENLGMTEIAEEHRRLAN